MEKREVSRILEEIGILLDLKGEDTFKVRAYLNASRTIETAEDDLDDLVREDRLKDLKGIGDALSKKIAELVSTGKLEYYENLKDSVPEGFLEMLKIPGLGPKKIKTLYQSLGLQSIGELEYACIENRLVENFPGFGKKSQERIREGISHIKKYRGKYLLGNVIHEAEALLEELMKKSWAAQRGGLAGSIRRGKETIKDIDIVVSTKEQKRTHGFFASLPAAEKVIARGETKSSITLQSGINADLRTVSDREFPFALHHFTGSKEHNTAMRHRAKNLGMKMNEYGLFKKEELIPCKDEEEVFEKLGLQYIPPELREDMGEIEAAEKGEIPLLIKEEDIRGVFHVHSDYSDGIDSIEKLAKEMKRRGYEYLGIADHSRSAYYAGGLNEKDIKKQHKEIDALNRKLKDFRIFKGIEVDILADGDLDYSDSILSTFDFVIVAVHSVFNQSRKEMTERICKAIENKYVTMLAHPTGRLLLSREPYQVDMIKVIGQAHKTGTVIELNANPHRLDIDWRLCPYAGKKGVRVSINPDAHSVEGVNDISFGIAAARKGWLGTKDVINTMHLIDMIEFLKKFQ